jgi:peptide/nickel transport system permease protein
MVEASLRLTYAIGLIAALSFLGFGEQPPAADWGLMINENRQALTVQPWGVVMPVIAIALLTIGTSLVGDGLARVSAGIDPQVGAETNTTTLRAPAR